MQGMIVQALQDSTGFLGCVSSMSNDALTNAIQDPIWQFGMQMFLIVWLIFFPVAMTARLERIIKLLEDKK